MLVLVYLETESPGRSSFWVKVVSSHLCYGKRPYEALSHDLAVNHLAGGKTEVRPVPL